KRDGAFVGRVNAASERPGRNRANIARSPASLGSPPARFRDMLGLPPATAACLFDLDGVLTQTASVHARAWKQVFDAFLQARPARPGEDDRPFDLVADYDAYVDGKPRADGVR